MIPTLDRLDVLPEVLAGLDRQAASPSVRDRRGRRRLDRRNRRIPRQLAGGAVRPGAPNRAPARVLRQVNRGPAAARNAGVRDGARPARRLPGRRHGAGAGMAWRRTGARSAGAAASESLAVLGYTRWHPRMTRSPFLEYINEYGASVRVFDHPRSRERAVQLLLHLQPLARPASACSTSPSTSISRIPPGRTSRPAIACFGVVCD